MTKVFTPLLTVAFVLLLTLPFSAASAEEPVCSCKKMCKVNADFECSSSLANPCHIGVKLRASIYGVMSGMFRSEVVDQVYFCQHYCKVVDGEKLCVRKNANDILPCDGRVCRFNFARDSDAPRVPKCYPVVDDVVCLNSDTNQLVSLATFCPTQEFHECINAHVSLNAKAFTDFRRYNKDQVCSCSLCKDKAPFMPELRASREDPCFLFEGHCHFSNSLQYRMPLGEVRMAGKKCNDAQTLEDFCQKC